MIAIGNTRFTFMTNVVRIVYLALAGWIGWTQLGPVGIVWAVGTVEVAAQLLAWVELRRRGFLDIPRELLFLATGLAGLVVGYGVEQAIMTVFNIH